MNKCDCYHTQTKRQYTYNPITGDPMGHDVDIGVCWGTKECEECSCGGDETKCDFYPEVRQKARKERKPKFGEWISVEDRLPSKSESVLSYSALGVAICNYSSKHKLFNAYDDNTIEDARGYCLYTTHWMPLPEPPKGE